MKERKRVQKMFSLPSKTRQEFKEECDLGKTIARFGKTPEGREVLRKAQGYVADVKFGDALAIPDFRAAQDAVRKAEASFMALPAVVRRRFANDPALFLDYATNPENLDEMRAMGLAKPKPVDQAPEKGA